MAITPETPWIIIMFTIEIDSWGYTPFSNTPKYQIVGNFPSYSHHIPVIHLVTSQFFRVKSEFVMVKSQIVRVKYRRFLLVTPTIFHRNICLLALPTGVVGAAGGAGAFWASRTCVCKTGDPAGTLKSAGLPACLVDLACS